MILACTQNFIILIDGQKGRLKYKVGQARAFGMIAGGSGITPMFQVNIELLMHATIFYFYLQYIYYYYFLIYIMFAGHASHFREP